MTLAEALSKIKLEDLDVTLTKPEQKELDETAEHDIYVPMPPKRTRRVMIKEKGEGK